MNLFAMDEAHIRAIIRDVGNLLTKPYQHRGDIDEAKCSAFRQKFLAMKQVRDGTAAAGTAPAGKAV
jgi:hypothetical protein